nr:hypothetical protein OH820_22300 [Streptomyces sp. NBC_00857]
MARHAAPSSPRQTLLRAGLTVTAASAVLGLGGTAAQAAEPSAPAPTTSTDSKLNDSKLAESGEAAVQGVVGALGHATAGALGPAKNLKLYPLAGTGVDPLDNAVGTQVADFKPVSTAILTDPLTKGGGALKNLPLVGPALGLLPG